MREDATFAPVVGRDSDEASYMGSNEWFGGFYGYKLDGRTEKMSLSRSTLLIPFNASFTDV
jgi:hypothetical protein